VESLCVTWLMPVGIGERRCENSLGDNIVNYNGIIMLDVLYLPVSGAPVYLYLLVGVCPSLVVLRVVFTYVYF